MLQVWSNLECYIADGDEYTKTKANDALLAELQPAANYVWHRQYQSSHGPEASGILLHTWLSKMQVTIDVLLSSQGSGNDAPGVTLRRAPAMLTAPVSAERTCIGTVHGHFRSDCGK